MKNLLLMMLLLNLSNSIYGQKQANIWHFGEGASLDFTTGNPVSSSGSLITTFEGSASYCDSAGNLILYTNGGGREPLSGQDGGKIWNRNNGIMYDMQGIEGGGFSSFQSAVIFEAPGQNNIYYVFTMDEIEYYIGASASINASQPFGRGLSYFTVDMNLNGGLGGVVTANQLVYTPSYEGLCAIKHSNNIDYWILINQDSTGLGVYSVTSSGVNFVNSFNAVGNSTGGIKASPDGTKVRISSYLLDFNPANGQISNQISLPSADFFEFSPNSQYLYENITVGNNIAVVRYDLTASPIVNSLTTIATLSNSAGKGNGQMQIGPDGKIYFLTPNFLSSSTLLNRINCPNSITPTVNFNTSSFNDLFFGLPNFSSWLFKNNDQTFVSLGPDSLTLCQADFPYTLNAQNPGSTYLWSTGDTTQSIVINSPGLYSVNVNGTCGVGNDQILIKPCASTSSICQEFFPAVTPQSLTIPSGVTSISVKMWGAAGGGGPDALNNAGGGGGYTSFTLPVVAGDLLEIVVGGGGQVAIGNNGGNGGYPFGGNGGSGNRIENFANVGGAGGGGGASAIKIVGSINAILAIAGAGGGGAYNRPGGGGGGLIAEYTAANNAFNIQGFGGTQVAGGAPSSNTLCPHPVSGTAGSQQLGGTGATDLGGSADRTGGGGGGDGYFGGGGGGSHDGCFGVGSAGGGGSGFLCSTCPNIIGSTQTAGFFGLPANNTDTLLSFYPGTALGVDNQNGGGGLVQICYESCVPTTDSILISICNNYTNPLGTVYSQTGIYNYTLLSSSGCDSNIVLDLNIIPPIQTNPQNVSACDNFTASWGITYNQSGIYSDTLVAANGCDSIISINLIINNSVNANTQNITACDNYTAPWGTTYTSSGLYSDTLTTINGCDSVLSINLSINNSSTPIVQQIVSCDTYISPWGTTYTQSGSYTDTISSANNCDSIITVNLTIINSSVPTTQTISTCNNYTAPWGTIYSQSGSYIDTLININGCDSILTINLTIFNQGQPTQQTINACGSYLSPSGNLITQSGIINDTLINSNGCDSIVITNLTISELPNISITTTKTGCAFDNGSALVSLNNGGSINSLIWSNGDTTTSIDSLAAGTYMVTVTNQNNCTDSGSAIIVLNDLPQINISASQLIIIEGDSVLLQASGANVYDWSPTIGLSCTNCESAFASPTQTTTYSVTGIDSNGCENSKTITINVDIKCNELFVPNIFSPNEEGPAINEKLCVFSNCINEINFGIYNRWGELIFQTSEIGVCWDGKYKSKYVTSGVYAYRLSAKLLNGKAIEQSGNITVVK